MLSLAFMLSQVCTCMVTNLLTIRKMVTGSTSLFQIYPIPTNVYVNANLNKRFFSFLLVIKCVNFKVLGNRTSQQIFVFSFASNTTHV